VILSKLRVWVDRSMIMQCGALGHLRVIVEE
jgi:hypothetical protein